MRRNEMCSPFAIDTIERQAANVFRSHRMSYTPMDAPMENVTVTNGMSLRENTRLDRKCSSEWWPEMNTSRHLFVPPSLERFEINILLVRSMPIEYWSRFNRLSVTRCVEEIDLDETISLYSMSSCIARNRRRRTFPPVHSNWIRLRKSDYYAHTSARFIHRRMHTLLAPVKCRQSWPSHSASAFASVYLYLSTHSHHTNGWTRDRHADDRTAAMMRLQMTHSGQSSPGIYLPNQFAAYDCWVNDAGLVYIFIILCFRCVWCDYNTLPEKKMSAFVFVSFPLALAFRIHSLL